MGYFSGISDAIDFVAAQIVRQADIEGINLSEIERRMLYFSQSGWTLPNIMETAESFERYYDDDQYEKKIARLIERVHHRLSNQNTTELKVWSEAVLIVKRDDRYLGVCLDVAKIRPPYDRLKLFGTGLLVVAVMVALALSLPNLELKMRGERLVFAIWTAATTMTVGWAIVYFVRGKLWASQFADRVIGKILNPLLPKKWR